VYYAPMPLTTADSPFTDEEFIFEPKIDGHRLLLSRSRGRTRLYTGQLADCTLQYPELLPIAADDIVLDGEVAATDAAGRIDGEAVKKRLALRDPGRIRQAAAADPVNYIVFDILRYKGADLRGLPLYQRKRILSGIRFGNPYIAQIPYIEEEGERLFREIQQRRWEGIVAKHSNSIYVINKTGAWQAIINWSEAEVVVTGYRKSGSGLLVAAASKNGALQPAGVVADGLTARHKMTLYRVRDALFTGEDGEWVYLAPLLKARVNMRGWTKAGQLRSPVFAAFVR
jgi:DNA ligase-1